MHLKQVNFKTHKAKINDMKSKIYKSINIVGDFKTPLSN